MPLLALGLVLSEQAVLVELVLPAVLFCCWGLVPGVLCKHARVAAVPLLMHADGQSKSEQDMAEE
jgi:hypothetical protein